MAAQAITPTSIWTNDSGQVNPATPSGLYSFTSMSRIVTSLVSFTPAAALASGEPWAMASVSFRPVVAAVEGTVQLIGTTGLSLDSTAGSPSAGVLTVQGATGGYPLSFGALPTGTSTIGYVGLTGPVAVTQSTSPWVVGGAVGVTGSVGMSGAVPTGSNVVGKVDILGSTGAALDALQGATAPANSLAVGGTYNTTIPALTAGAQSAVQLDSTGAQAVNAEGRKQTYRVGVVGFAPLASASAPSVSIAGSASKTVKVTRVRLSAWPARARR